MRVDGKLSGNGRTALLCQAEASHTLFLDDSFMILGAFHESEDLLHNLSSLCSAVVVHVNNLPGVLATKTIDCREDEPFMICDLSLQSP